MWKAVLAGTTALAIAGSSLVYAQQGSDDFQRGPRWRPSDEDISAFGDARIAALHAGLKLTPEQEKNWPAVESALREIAKQRSEHYAARASGDRPQDPIERLNMRADAMGQRAVAPRSSLMRQARSTRVSTITRSVVLLCSPVSAPARTDTGAAVTAPGSIIAVATAE